MRPVAATVLTIGYEDRLPDELLRDLQNAGVDVLLDVRELPLSRRRGFSKTRLSELLEAGGVRYEHDKRLGNPRPYRELYWAGDTEAGADAYRGHLHNGSDPALVELAARLRSERICLLCVEHDVERCHRAVIVEALQARLPRLAVRHL